MGFNLSSTLNWCQSIQLFYYTVSLSCWISFCGCEDMKKESDIKFPSNQIAKAVKPSADVRKEKLSNGVNSPNSFADPEKFVEDFLEKTSSLVLSEVRK